MIVIPGRNANLIFPVTMMHMQQNGELRANRNSASLGDTLELGSPLTLRYFRPTERVLFHQKRRINPFLHFFEPLWILAGRRDTGFMHHILAKFDEYSDDGKDFYGAYGYRLRTEDGDQVAEAIRTLKANPDDRRVALVIRRPYDMWYDGKDQPCNLTLTCRVRGGALDLHVFNRSNDMIWGALGANYPQFSVIQEYIAAGAGYKVGQLYQITTCPHVYVNEQWEKVMFSPLNVFCPYSEGEVRPYPMFEEGIGAFDEDLEAFFEHYDEDRLHMFVPRTTYFKEVVMPMWRTFIHWKAKQDGKALQEVLNVKAEDWSMYLNFFITTRGAA